MKAEVLFIYDSSWINQTLDVAHKVKHCAAIAQSGAKTEPKNALKLSANPPPQTSLDSTSWITSKTQAVWSAHQVHATLVQIHGWLRASENYT